MKNLILLLFLSVAILFNSGCSKLTSFEKRKYNKGYHVDFAEKKNKKKKPSASEIISVLPETDVKKTDTEATVAIVLEDTNISLVSETEVIAEEIPQPVVSVEKKKNFLNASYKTIGKKHRNTFLKKNFQNILPHKNTAGISEEMYFSGLALAGILVALFGLFFLVISVFLIQSFGLLIFSIVITLGGATMIVCGVLFYY